MSEPLITSVVVEGLFGQYDYELPRKPSCFGDAVILYGDNGVGKSTILRLLFDMLSPANNRGHRTALANSPFSKIEIRMGTGHVIKAHRKNTDPDGNPVRSLELSISRNDEALAIWRYSPDEEKRSISGDLQLSLQDRDGLSLFDWRTVASSIEEDHHHHHVARIFNTRSGNTAYIEALIKYVPIVFILTAERRLDSDSLQEDTTREFERSLLSQPERLRDLAARSREIALSQALSLAATSISQKAFIGANQGSTNVHAVYVNLLKHLSATAPQNISQRVATPERLLERLHGIKDTADRYAKYGLSTRLDISTFETSLQNPELTKDDLVANLLEPYISSLESRFSAIAPIYDTLDKFISIINSFLSRKLLGYDALHGFAIVDSKSNKELEPALLSSGEKQLLLLFCYVLISMDRPSIFIIDEPELSLNVKWQRKLVQSLLDIAAGKGNTQFIFASHSMELLAQHRHRVVRVGEIET